MEVATYQLFWIPNKILARVFSVAAFFKTFTIAVFPVQYVQKPFDSP